MNTIDFEARFSVPKNHIFSSRPKEKLSLVSRARDTGRHIKTFFSQFWGRMIGIKVKKRDQFFVSRIYDRLYNVSTNDWIKTKNELRYEIEFKKEIMEVNGWFLKSVYVQMLSGLLDQMDCSSV